MEHFSMAAITEINQLAGRNPLSLVSSLIILGTSYRVLEIFKQNIKCILQVKAVANLGYDELTDFGGTSPNFLNGLAGSGLIPMKHCKK
jgi:iron complex outermembrane receptor protein